MALGRWRLSRWRLGRGGARHRGAETNRDDGRKNDPHDGRLPLRIFDRITAPPFRLACRRLRAGKWSMRPPCRQFPQPTRAKRRSSRRRRAAIANDSVDEGRGEFHARKRLRTYQEQIIYQMRNTGLQSDAVLIPSPACGGGLGRGNSTAQTSLQEPPPPTPPQAGEGAKALRSDPHLGLAAHDRP